jgi:hypothetical protein
VIILIRTTTTHKNRGHELDKNIINNNHACFFWLKSMGRDRDHANANANANALLR